MNLNLRPPQSETTPSLPPQKKAKKANSSKKGKEKMLEPIAESDEELESDATPSPPPLKKGKAAMSSMKGKRKMTTEEISHYYSSSS